MAPSTLSPKDARDAMFDLVQQAVKQRAGKRMAEVADAPMGWLHQAVNTINRRLPYGTPKDEHATAAYGYFRRKFVVTEDGGKVSIAPRGPLSVEPFTEHGLRDWMAMQYTTRGSLKPGIVLVEDGVFNFREMSPKDGAAFVLQRLEETLRSADETYRWVLAHKGKMTERTDKTPDVSRHDDRYSDWCVVGPMLVVKNTNGEVLELPVAPDRLEAVLRKAIDFAAEGVKVTREELQFDPNAPTTPYKPGPDYDDPDGAFILHYTR